MNGYKLKVITTGHDFTFEKIFENYTFTETEFSYDIEAVDESGYFTVILFKNDENIVWSKTKYYGSTHYTIEKGEITILAILY